MLKRIIVKIRNEYLKELKWMLPYALKYWKAICFYMISGVISIVMGLGSSVVSKKLIDVVTGDGGGSLKIWACAMIGMAVGNIVMNAIVTRISARISVLVQNELQADIFDMVLHSDWEALHEFRSGDLLNRLNVDAAQVAASIIGWIPSLLTKLTHFIGALCIILYYDPIMAVIALLSAPFTVAMSGYLMKRMRRHNKEMRDLSSELMSFQNDSFQKLQTVKAFGLMDLFTENLHMLQEQYKAKTLDYNRFSVYVSTFMSLVGLAVSYSCFGWSVYRLWTGYITVGTLMMFVSMATSLTSAFKSLVQLVPAAINATTCAGRLMAVSQLDKEQRADAAALEMLERIADNLSAIELENVDVVYKEGNTVLNNGNFYAHKGEVVAIVGASGEGKTTLMRIFLGLIFPTHGKAQLIANDGTTQSLSALTRGLFGYVPQGNTVFTGTIADNMRMVKKDATDEEIVEALKAACAYDFVSKLPNGINSSIKEQGTGISEGQAQRIAIARAIIKQAPILLLDEATSALDMEVEEQVLKNIMNLDTHRICIVSTHRSSVLGMSDHVYEIKDNKLLKLR